MVMTKRRLQFDKVVDAIGLAAAIQLDQEIICRLAAMLDIVEAAEKVVVYPPYCNSPYPDFQYRDRGELHKAIKKLADFNHTCPKHPGASPPCSDDECECYGRAMDLAGAYQSILDGRM
jgi:hypothetical protein